MSIFSFFKRKKQSFNDSYSKANNSKKIGLALSGGGAKGFAHIGVLRAFEEANLNFDIVVGTSVGSLVGAFYSAGISTQRMEEIGKTLKTSDLLDKKILISPSKSQNIEKLVKSVIGDMEFKDLEKKFACCTTDLLNGEEVVLEDGLLSTAISASCSAPIFFDGVEISGKRLYDGGLVNNLPADVARRLGADFVVGVTLTNTGMEGTDKTNFFSVAKATFNIMSKSTSTKGIMNSDVLISPVLTGRKSSKIEDEKIIQDMISAGYESAKVQIPQIVELLKIT